MKSSNIGSVPSSSDHVSYIDGAVVDLVHGYDSIIDTLPNVAQRVKQMQTATEDMANTLEKRMRHLVDGYEYLDSISAQVPESLRENAAAHKKSLLDVAQLLGPSYEQNYLNHNKELDRLRSELQSITHERVVVDVLTRQSIKQAKRKKVAVSSRNKEKSKEIPYEPIAVPLFNPQQSGPASTPSNPTKNPKNSAPAGSTRVSVRAPGPGSLMVPSMRQGVLPPEVANLKTIPKEGSSKKARCATDSILCIIYLFCPKM
jgi:hypothetical protein